MATPERRARRLLSALGLLLAASGATAQTSPPGVEVDGVPPVGAFAWEAATPWRHIREARLVGWLPGETGGLLVITRFGVTEQVHRVESPGGLREQITFGEASVEEARLSPDPRRVRLAFTRRGGSGIQILDLRTRAGLSIAEGLASPRHLLWDPSGRRLACAGPDSALLVVEALPGALPRPVGEGSGRWRPLAWSPDGTRLLAESRRAGEDPRLWLVDPTGGRSRALEVGEGPVSYGSAFFDASGRGLYLVSDRGEGRAELVHLSLADASAEAGNRLLTPDLRWPVEEAAFCPDGGVLAFTTNEAGTGHLHLLDPRDGRPRPVDLPLGVISDLRFDGRGRRLAFTLQTPRSPRDVYALELDGLDRQRLVRWTVSEMGGLAPEDLLEPTLIHFRTFDTGRSGATREIPALYYRPTGPGPHPIVIYIHGGPEEQVRPGFSASFQRWSRDLGLAVLAPNVRGSRGWGRDYARLDDGRLREDAVRDVGALLDWIEGRDELDAGRVGMVGAGYGGYLVLASLASHGERIHAAVEMDGLIDLVAYLGDEHGGDRSEYGDERVEATRTWLASISPRAWVGRLETPLLVVEGAQGPSSMEQSLQADLPALRKRGVEVWYMRIDDGGSALRRNESRDYLEAVVASFWRTRLTARQPR